MRLSEIDSVLAEEVITPTQLKQRLKQKALVNRVAKSDMPPQVTDTDKVLALRKYAALKKQVNQYYAAQQQQSPQQITQSF